MASSQIFFFSNASPVPLFACVLAIFLGPVVHSLIRGRKEFLQWVDGFTLVVIVGLVLADLIPHSIHEMGWPAVLFALIGLVLPTVLEKNFRRGLAKKTHVFTLVFAIIGVVIHQMGDGVALLGANLLGKEGDPSHAISLLPLAVILHQLPVGLMIWWLIKPAYGDTKAFLVLCLLALATIVGFVAGDHMLFQIEGGYFALLTALLGGTLLHVVFHRHESFVVPADSQRWQWAAGLGALAGLFVVLYVQHAHPAPVTTNFEQPLRIFLRLARESAPALVFAYIISGFIYVFLPASSVRWLKKGSALTQSFGGMAAGLPIPVCSCGVVPLYRTLIMQGVPLSAAVSFFVATPELGIDAILLSLPLLGKNMMLIRLASAALVAVLAGLIMGALFKNTQGQHGPAKGFPAQGHRTFFKKLQEGLRMSFEDVVDHTAPWILLGLLVAAILEPFLSTNAIFAQIPGALQVPLFALLGLPVYVCASGATPLVAVLIHNGVSPGAALAFLITGPATNVTTFGVLSQLHGRRMALSFSVVMATLSILLGYVVDLFFRDTIHVSALQHVGHEPAIYKTGFLIVLFSLYAGALLRGGPRRFIGQIISFDTDDERAKEKNCCCH